MTSETFTIPTTELMGHTWNDYYLARHPGVHEALKTELIEGIPFRILDTEIEPGDTYIAELNTGVRLLTCRENVKDMVFICPVENAYAYDTDECIKIELLID